MDREPGALRLSILRHLDADDVSTRAAIEVKRRETYLPPIVVYRWWARRTEAVFGSLLDAAEQDLGSEMLVVDPFAGGGVVSLAAASRNHRIYAQDVNPWAARGLTTMLRLTNSQALQKAYEELERASRNLRKRAYATTLADGSPGEIAHTLRVAVSSCSACRHRHRIFPHALVSLTHRRERDDSGAWLACPAGHLFHGDSTVHHRCPRCARRVDPYANYTTNRMITCPSCNHNEPIAARTRDQQLSWDVALVERVGADRRELARPRPNEIRQANDPCWKPTKRLGKIDVGPETSSLRRHGFKTLDDLYPRRQQFVLEQLLEKAAKIEGVHGSASQLLKTLLRGTSEMAGHLSRWDRYYLKSYEAMAGHRYNFTTLAAEPNVWGATSGRGTLTRRVARTSGAIDWMEEQMGGALLVRRSTALGSRSRMPKAFDAWVVEGGSQRLVLQGGTADLVLTDPPYHDDVQYGALSLPLLAWSGIRTGAPTDEAVPNGREGLIRNGASYRTTLTRIFKEIRRVLKPTGHLVLTFANRNLDAWADLLAALDTAGFEALGYEIVHAENETEYRKRGLRSCSLDLVLDLAAKDASPRRRHRAKATLDGIEADFLRAIGEYSLKIGYLSAGWEKRFPRRLDQQRFIAPRSVRS
ncbi:MAG: hypothetical protein WD271_14440 [Acidimicrobiia bacterium]